ncbi:MAG TPA: DnaA regulatory inactivator Hda, partial [Burkholderiaceae bacterium]|nr:DnaA regulatory inactivator Hda [Burkholderiaceae bacterium]
MTQQLILELLPPSPPTLDNFVAGDNAAAIDALRRSEGGRAVYLWGAPGVGRSHLLRAAAARPDGMYFGSGD